VYNNQPKTTSVSKNFSFISYKSVIKFFNFNKICILFILYLHHDIYIYILIKTKVKNNMLVGAVQINGSNYYSCNLIVKLVLSFEEQTLWTEIFRTESE